jgi:hypothetical protein
MSGGSYNYMYFSFLETYGGHMKDKFMDEFIKDFSELLYELEWADSGDTSEEQYLEALSKFKEKWFTEANSEVKKELIEKIKLEAIEEIKRL